MQILARRAWFWKIRHYITPCAGLEYYIWCGWLGIVGGDPDRSFMKQSIVMTLIYVGIATCIHGIIASFPATGCTACLAT